MKLCVLVAYVGMMIVVICLTARKNLSLNEFLLGGRRVGPWMSALSYGASYFSAVIIVGYAGSTGWNVGFSAVWCGIGNALVGSLLAWSLLAKPTRRMGEKLKIGTLPGFFEKRYQSKTLKVIASLMIFVFLLPYSASVYKGLGNMFEKAFGFDYTWCVVGIALLSALYLFAGGYKATAITDFIQGIIMIAGIAAVVFYIVRAAGGVSGGLEALGQPEIGGEGFNTIFPTQDKSAWLLSNVLLTSLGVLGMPQMIHKFFAIRDEASVKRATVISTVFALVVAGGAYFAGSFGRVVLAKIAAPEGGTMADLVKNGSMSLDQIMPTLLTDTTVVGIPDALLGLFVVLLLSASISTLTSLVLSSSSVLTLDLLGSVMPRMKQKTATWTMRSLCIVFVALSLVINFLLQGTPIVSLMSLSWGTIAGAFLAPFLYGLLWRGVTKIGAFAGVIGGALISLLPPLVTGDMSLAPLSGAAAMLGGLIVVPVVSLLTRRTAYAKEDMDAIFGEEPDGPLTAQAALDR
ncbi:MAG: sodium:solute symporter [Eubacteriales bacterium]|nr:sodium:solute symporter [Eubacteriales bacterium]